ncbi:MAG: ribose 5-phosphate isomerase B [Bacteroidetes bacterium]|jgi:ribose 5-phosphate isomerase B|nr:ribose 5-phosphate isomerase B [Bacteroidota bacterium]
MNLAIGSDHAGFKLKNELLVYLLEKGLELQDFGPDSADSVDYPDYAHKVAESVSTGENDLGILICGSGNGVCITANKHKGIRAALAWEEEIAALARQHNNANVLCVPARFVSKAKAFKIVDAWLDATFEGGRHQNRVSKIED